jgi:aminoglycoside phosphotransferase (APT) family kinase protein
MRYAAEHGFAVPEIHEVRGGGTEVVMERIEGPSMMDVMARRPWSMGRLARVLGDLHDRLHEITAPDWLARLDGGDRLLHLDLHPMNVLLAPRGPVVIDWTNAAAGDPLADVANTVVLTVCPEVPLPRPVQVLAEPARAFLARSFAARYRGPALDRQLVEMAELKTLDRNMSGREVERLQRYAGRVRARLAS